MSDLLSVILALALAGALYLYWRERQKSAQHQQTIATLQASKITTEEHNRTMDALQATITDQKRALDALHEAREARDHAAAALKTDVEMKTTRIQDLEAAQAAHDTLVGGLRADLADKETRLAQAANTIATLERDLDYKIALTLTLGNSAYNALLVLDAHKQVIAINDTAEQLFARVRPMGESLIDVTQSPEIESIVDGALAYWEESFEEQVVLNKRTYRVRAQVIQRTNNMFVALALDDITDLVRLNRARRDMVANISHELRTPIANIRLIIDSIFHEQEKPKGKASRSALKAIAQETDSLLWLVQELLDLSMIESGQAILRMVEVPADMLVSEAVERMVDQSDTKGLTIISKVPENVPVLCDRDQARRVLINLIHNAIKWSPPEQTITVEVRAGDDDVTFAVLDNGPGVPDDQQERIFERFYQVDPSRSGGDGTGLGLAICKHIVEAHGGRIWAEGNSSGGGGRFLFTLPGATERVEMSDSPEFA